MEKFSKWRDPGSGIHPFIPIKKGLSESAGDNDFNLIYGILNDFLLGPLLGTVKFILLLPLLVLWMTLASLLAGLRVPFGLLRVFDKVFGFLALVLLGFYSFPRRRMVIRAALAAASRSRYESFSLHSEKSSHPRDSVQPGDWIISNLSSYLDLICNWYWYSGTVAVVDDFDSGNMEICSNRFKAFYSLFLNRNEKVDKEDKKFINTNSKAYNNNHYMKDQFLNYHYPLIIFPEGRASNGRGVLKFIADLSFARRNQRLHLTCTKFATSPSLCPTFPLQGADQLLPLIGHIWQVCAQLRNQLTNRTILPATIFASNFNLPNADEREENGLGGSGGGGGSLLYNRTLQQIVAALGHLRPLNLSATDKISFFQTYFK